MQGKIQVEPLPGRGLCMPLILINDAVLQLLYEIIFTNECCVCQDRLTTRQQQQ